MISNSHNISLGFSSCPNDCFIFDALVQRKIDMEGLSFDYHIADVEELNKMAFQEKIDVTKISFHAFTKLSQQYSLLRAGAALAKDCGPLMISKKEQSRKALKDIVIGIPGENTTAAMFLSIFYPEITQKKVYVFNEIEDAIENNEIDWGLIIHENRFTYKEKGFIAIDDLGKRWHNKYKLAVPLGGIIANNRLGKERIQKINRVLQRSVVFAFNNPNSSAKFVKEHAQGIDDDIIKMHIELYVNEYSIDLKENGIKAISTLFEKAKEYKYINDYNKNFVIKNIEK